MKIQFFVPGVPQPGGSKKAFVRGKRAVVVEDCQKNRPWRNEVSSRATDAYGLDPLRGPIRLAVIFTMPRPKSHYLTGRNAGKLRANAPYYHTSKPDATKLLRSCEDALTGIIWADDAQVVQQSVVKLYGTRPGAEVKVETLEGTDG